MRGRVEELQAKVAQQAAVIEALRAELALSKGQVQHLLRQRFGSKSETLDPRQLELLLRGLERHDIEAEAPMAPPAEPKPTRRRAPRKPRIPEDLLTEEHVLVPEEVEANPDAFVEIAREITQELGVVAPVYFRRLFIRPKFVSKADRCAPPLIAPLPPRLIPGSYASPELLTDITTKKFLDHLPLYRQEQALKRHGIELSRKTMCDWVHQVAWWLKPIYNHIRDRLRDGGYLQVDETPIRFCGSGDGRSKMGYLWAYHRPALAGATGSAVLFEWHTGRGAACLGGMLGEFGGTLQTDGYSAYQSYAAARAQQIAAGADKPAIELAACWAHARRKFHEAIEECPSQAGWMLRQIQLLYAIETRLREAHTGERARIRALESAPILTRLEKALRLKLPAHRPSSRMGKAIQYALKLWAPLGSFVHDGRLEIDNNGVENSIRPSAIGKKNWLFFGAPQAGEHAAVIYTILENCKREGINPNEYLLEVLRRLPEMKQAQVAELTPAAWAAQRRKRVA